MNSKIQSPVFYGHILHAISVAWRTSSLLVRITNGAVLILLIEITTIASANASPGLAPPPAMPAKFDRDTVTQLIGAAEQGNNALILKFGYYIRRGAPQTFPLSDGLALLRSAIEKEPVATKRWFILQSIRGFASLRISAETRAEAFRAYGELFDRASDAQKAGAGDDVERAVYEYAVSASTDFMAQHVREYDVKGIMLKAFKAHLEYLKKYEEIPVSIDWKQAIDIVQNDGGFVEEALRVIDDNTVHKTLSLLTTSASVIERKDSKKALELMYIAKPLLSRNNTSQMRNYYASLTEMLIRAGHFEEAIKEQKEFIDILHTGYADLLALYHARNDLEGLQETIKSLTRVGGDEREINTSAETLLRWYQENPQNSKDIANLVDDLLSKYLSASYDRETGEELHARYLLGRLLMKEGKYADAKVVLDRAGALSPIPSGLAAAYFSSIQRLQVRLSAQMANQKEKLQ